MASFKETIKKISSIDKTKAAAVEKREKEDSERSAEAFEREESWQKKLIVSFGFSTMMDNFRLTGRMSLLRPKKKLTKAEQEKQLREKIFKMQIRDEKAEAVFHKRDAQLQEKQIEIAERGMKAFDKLLEEEGDESGAGERDAQLQEKQIEIAENIAEDVDLSHRQKTQEEGDVSEATGAGATEEKREEKKLDRDRNSYLKEIASKLDGLGGGGGGDEGGGGRGGGRFGRGKMGKMGGLMGKMFGGAAGGIIAGFVMALGTPQVAIASGIFAVSAAAIATGLGAFIAIFGELGSIGLDALADSFPPFVNSLKTFETLNGDDLKQAAEGVGAVLTSLPSVEGLLTFIPDGEELSALADALIKMNDVKPEVMQLVGPAIKDLGMGLKDAALGEVFSGIAGVFAEEGKETGLAAQMSALAAGLREFSGDDIDSEKIAAVGPAIKAMGEGLEDAGLGDLWSSIGSIFSSDDEQKESLSDKLKGIADGFRHFENLNVETLAAVGPAVRLLGQGLEAMGSGDLFSALGGLVEGFASIFNSEKKDPIEDIKRFAVLGEGKIGNNLRTAGSSIAALGRGIRNFNDSIADFDPSDISEIILPLAELGRAFNSKVFLLKTNPLESVITSLSGLTALENINGTRTKTKLDDIGKGLHEFIDWIDDDAEKGGLETDVLAAYVRAVSGPIRAVAGAVTGSPPANQTGGTSYDQELQAGTAGAAGKVEAAADGAVAAGETAIGFEEAGYARRQKLVDLGIKSYVMVGGERMEDLTPLSEAQYKKILELHEAQPTVAAAAVKDAVGAMPAPRSEIKEIDKQIAAEKQKFARARELEKIQDAETAAFDEKFSSAEEWDEFDTGEEGRFQDPEINKQWMEMIASQREQKDMMGVDSTETHMRNIKTLMGAAEAGMSAEEFMKGGTPRSERTRQKWIENAMRRRGVEEETGLPASEAGGRPGIKALGEIYSVASTPELQGLASLAGEEALKEEVSNINAIMTPKEYAALTPNKDLQDKGNELMIDLAAAGLTEGSIYTNDQNATVMLEKLHDRFLAITGKDVTDPAFMGNIIEDARPVFNQVFEKAMPAIDSMTEKFVKAAKRVQASTDKELAADILLETGEKASVENIAEVRKTWSDYLKSKAAQDWIKNPNVNADMWKSAVAEMQGETDVEQLAGRIQKSLPNLHSAIGGDGTDENLGPASAKINWARTSKNLNVLTNALSETGGAGRRMTAKALEASVGDGASAGGGNVAINAPNVITTTSTSNTSVSSVPMTNSRTHRLEVAH